MYRSILVSLDGSAFGEQALPVALSIARRVGASLNLVHVHVPYGMMYPDSMSPFGPAQDRQIIEHERAYLDETVKRLTSSSTVPVTSTVLEGMVVAETLSGHAADLIVMTTHGRGPLSRFWLGSVADELVRRATVPVLLVRPQETPSAAEPVFRHILIPLDGSILAEQVLEPATALGRLMEAKYTLLRVYGPVEESRLGPEVHRLEPPTEELRKAAQAYLDGVAERLRRQGHTTQTQVAFGQHPPSVILDVAQSHAVDLIALETHGRRGVARLLLGSVADKVLRGAVTPVLIHHSPGK
jgi:nucleotide-binding universal stress UspA family protein